jgi:predicted RNA binding protein YcfA (HicA-like mRNA interferase family)
VKSVSGKELCRVLERHGWSLLRVQGSHHVYGMSGKLARLSVPVHGKPGSQAGSAPSPAADRRAHGTRSVTFA